MKLAALFRAVRNGVLVAAAMTSVSAAATTLPPLELTSQPMALYLGRITGFEPAVVPAEGGPVRISYAKGCTENFENLVMHPIPTIDPSRPQDLVIGAVFSGHYCDDCRCPDESHDVLLDFTRLMSSQQLVPINIVSRQDSDYFAARILDISQAEVSTAEIEVTVTYMETCDTSLIDVIPVQVSPFGGYLQQIGVLALVQKKADDSCPMPSHPQSSKFRYPTSQGGYRFIAISSSREAL